MLVSLVQFLPADAFTGHAAGTAFRSPEPVEISDGRPDNDVHPLRRKLMEDNGVGLGQKREGLPADEVVHPGRRSPLPALRFAHRERGCAAGSGR